MKAQGKETTMKTTIFAALALTLLPAIAAACPYKDKTASMSCPAGHVWDETARNCVIQSS
jgi:hypothetical protein